MVGSELVRAFFTLFLVNQPMMIIVACLIRERGSRNR